MAVQFLVSLLRNHPDCIILDDWDFHSLISVGELFANALRRFETCLLVNNGSCGKLILSSKLPVIFYDNLKSTFVLFVIAVLFIKQWIWKLYI